MWRIWAAALLWGFNWPAVKIILGHAGPWTLRAAGLTGGAVVLAVIARAMSQPLGLARADWGRVAVASLLNITGFNICAVFAQLSMPTSRAAILTFTMPLWAAAISWIFLGEAIDRLRAVSLALGAAGIATLSVPFWPVVAAGGLPVGLLYVMGAAISWAAGTVYLKQRPIAAPAMTSTLWQVVLGAVACSIGLALFETPRIDLSAPPALIAFLYHVAFPQAVAYVLWFTLMQKVPAATAALGTLLIPLFAVIGAVMILDDWPTGLDLAGLALILAAVGLDQVVRGWRN